MELKLHQKVIFPCGNYARLVQGTSGMYLEFEDRACMRKYLSGLKSRSSTCFSPETSYSELIAYVSKIKGIKAAKEDYRVAISRITPYSCTLRFGMYKGLKGTRNIIKECMSCG